LLIAKTPVTSNTSNVTPIRSEIAEVEHLRILNRALLQRNSVLAARLEYHGKLYKLHCKTIKDDVVTELLKMFKMMYTEDGVVTWSKVSEEQSDEWKVVSCASRRCVAVASLQPSFAADNHQRLLFSAARSSPPLAPRPEG